MCINMFIVFLDRCHVICALTLYLLDLSNSLNLGNVLGDILLILCVIFVVFTNLQNTDESTKHPACPHSRITWLDKTLYYVCPYPYLCSQFLVLINHSYKTLQTQYMHEYIILHNLAKPIE